jgi:hypothetical protein
MFPMADYMQFSSNNSIKTKKSLHELSFFSQSGLYINNQGACCPEGASFSERSPGKSVVPIY